MKLKQILIVTIGLCFLSVSAASAFKIYGVDDDSDTIKLFDTSTGNYDVIAQGVPDEIESLTWAGGTTYYGMRSDNARDSTSQLYKFDISGDDVTWEAVGGEIAYNNIDALQYADGMLYATDNKKDKLLALNTNGEVQGSVDVGALGLKKVEGLAYNNGTLYASDTNNDGQKPTDDKAYTDHSSALFTIDISNINISQGSITGIDVQNVGQIGFGQVEALLFADGALYGTSDMHNVFFQIDLNATGDLGTYLNDWGSDIEGVAIAETAVPEPSTIILLGFGLLGLAAFKRKRK